MRRFSRAEILIMVADAQGRPDLVVSCVPGGAQPAPARGVALDGTVEQARRDAAGFWNESALSALDAIQEELGSGLPPDPDHLADLTTFADVRRMAGRARQLDPDDLVAALTSARAELLADDSAAALREFGAVAAAEPGRRERLYHLACGDPRFIVLRWHPDIGTALGCPEVPPEWFVVRAQGLVPGADGGDVPPALGPEGTVMPGGDLVDAGASPPVEPSTTTSPTTTTTTTTTTTGGGGLGEGRIP
jgi:hypothetical protein